MIRTHINDEKVLPCLVSVGAPVRLFSATYEFVYTCVWIVKMENEREPTAICLIFRDKLGRMRQWIQDMKGFKRLGCSGYECAMVGFARVVEIETKDIN